MTHDLMDMKWCDICGEEFDSELAMQEHTDKIHIPEHDRYVAEYKRTHGGRSW